MNSLLSIPMLAALTTGGDGSLLRSAKLPRSSVNNSMDSTNSHAVIFAALVGGGDGGSLVNALIAVVVIGLIAWLLWWLLDFAGVPQPFNKVGKVLIALIAVVLLIRLIVRVTGVSL